MASKDESIQLRAATWALEQINFEHFSRSRVAIEAVVDHVVQVKQPAFDMEKYLKVCKAHWDVPDDGPAA